MNYKHTQTGYIMIGIMILIAALYSYILARINYDMMMLVLMLVILIILGSFSWLTVRVDKTHVHMSFSYGIFKKNFALKDITSVRVVKNHWIYGWGIRFVLWPRMWIYNVSGFDAVEIRMTNNQIYRIGTDEPQLLEKAITQARK